MKNNILGRLADFFLTEDVPEPSEKISPPIEYDVRNEKKETPVPPISKNVETNYTYMAERFTYPDNNDVVIKQFTMKNNVNGFMVFIEGMAKTDFMNDAIINPLQQLPLLDDNYNIDETVIKKFISHSQARIITDFDEICDEITFGAAAVFIDGIDMCFSMDVRGWEHRSINKPENEQSIYGPQEAFGEMLRTNSALVRKIVKTEKLVCEAVKIGTVSKTRGVIMYIKGVTNEELLNEVRQRINSITTEYVIAIEDVSLMLEEKSYIVTSTIFSSERPDRVARALTEGKVALLLNGSPNALIFPTTALEMTTSSSDYYMRVNYANMTRIIRFIAYLFSCLLPGLYIAAIMFHQEIIPTYLMYSISASRENVPFSSFIELILMDFAFEMIREAGIRMPSSIGSTLSIVGGLIIGQAAVSAKLVSPIMIIVIAVTGIGSFASVDYSLGWSYRILRLIFIMLGTLMGFYGIAAGICVYSVYIASIKNFGVPFLPENFFLRKNSAGNSVFVNPIWKMEKRPEFLDAKDKKLEPKISRKWNNKNK